jgi:hypothetical protein
MEEKINPMDALRKETLNKIALEEKEAGDGRVRKFIEVNRDSYIDNSTGEVDMEKRNTAIIAIVYKMFLIWYGKEVADKALMNVEFVDFKNLQKADWEKLIQKDPSAYGHVMMNKDSTGINYQEKEPKVKILDMKEFVGKPRSEVIKAVVDYVEKSGGQYHIPGLEYEGYLLENPDKVPPELKDGNCYYFIGSLLRDRNGHSDVPCVYRGGDKLNRGANWLDSEWSEDDRVLLLEK